jgi:hypothetical protein
MDLTGMEKSENEYGWTFYLTKETDRIQNHIRIQFLLVTGSLHCKKTVSYFPVHSRDLIIPGQGEFG